MKHRLRTAVTSILAMLLLAALAGPASAHTPAQDRLVKAGWSCEDLGALGWHCFNPPNTAAMAAGEAPVSVTVKVFLVEDGHETFAGTELLLRADVFERNPNERPCPQDGGHWHDLRPMGLPYYACHHYDTSA